MLALEELMSIVRKFGDVESVASSDAVTADGTRVSCTEIKLRLREGASIDALITILRMSGFTVESSSRRGLKAKLVISDA